MAGSVRENLHGAQDLARRCPARLARESRRSMLPSAMGNDHGESTQEAGPSRTTELVDGAFAPAERDGTPAPPPRAPKRSAFLLVYHREGVDVAPLAPGTSVIVGREPP